MSQPKRKIVLFKVDGRIVVEEITNLYPNQIDEKAWMVAHELNRSYYDIEVVTIEPTQELSDYDVTDEGIVCFTDLYFEPVTGVKCTVDIDTLLEVINNGDVENCFKLF